MSNRSYSYWLLNGNFGIEFFVRSGLTANYSLAFPNVAPTDGQYLRWNNTAQALEWGIPAVGGGGTVSSVGLVLPSSEFTVSNSPVNSSGNLTATWNSQNANRVLAAPNGSNGVPTFRTLVNADIPSGIDASKITGLLDRANIPNATNATSFQIGTSGVTLANDSGGLRVTSDGTQLSDLTVRNLNVTGVVDTQSSTNTNIGDSSITLLANSTGTTPTLDAFLAVKRGDITSARMQWTEGRDKWQAGLTDNLLDVSRSNSVSITNASITGGQYVFNHNLQLTDRDPIITVKTDTNRQILLGVAFNPPNSCTLDFSRIGSFSGTWTITAQA